MKIAIYAHEIVPEIGHSRALIETINKMPVNEISKLYVVSFEMEDAKTIFPDFHERVEFIKVPKLYIGPFLIKMVYFWIYSWFITRLKFTSEVKKVGIGISSLCVDFVNIQFIHKEWEHFYFSRFSYPLYKYIYKKTLFFFFSLGENYLYRFKTKTKFSVLSAFEQNYLVDSFNVPKKNTLLNYSGINLDNFDFPSSSKEETINSLLPNYPQLKSLDISKPIYLFVGAFERKGLHIVLEKIRKVEAAQLLVIGKPESAKGLKLPDDLNITYIEFTKQIQKFYHLADCFIFPTIYEPFGLVLVEAACMGLEVYTTRYKVGASELLENLDGIHLFDTPEEIEISPLKNRLEITHKKELRNQRIDRLSQITWQDTGHNFWKLLSS